VSASTATTDRDTAEVDPAVRSIFGEHTARAEAYAELLITVGITRGVIGPREAGRIWERHLLNSAVLGTLIAPQSRVVDLGSGAGLPGLPIAIARPDVAMTLLEPMQRRVAFLNECVQELELGNVSVVQGRAESPLPKRSPLARQADYVVVRAVASLDRLIKVGFELLADNGSLLALKGSTAAGELEEVRRVMTVDAELLTVPAPGRDATVVRVCRGKR
jgi:16S rRNA (guanine527-N7)-methyltransferase